MQFKAFSVYDTKAKAFRPPFFVSHTGEALRLFEDLVNDSNSVVAKHPSDYILYEIGGFNDSTAESTNTIPPVNLAVGSSLVVRKDVAARSAVVEALNNLSEEDLQSLRKLLNGKEFELEVKK